MTQKTSSTVVPVPATCTHVPTGVYTPGSKRSTRTVIIIKSREFPNLQMWPQIYKCETTVLRTSTTRYVVRSTG